MTADNLKTWNRFADIDPAYTKPITGKAYKGTSPNPQYIIRCLTEIFGPVGQGFGWDVMQEAFTPLGEEILHWCRIRFWHGDRANAFDAYGQTKALMKTKNGLMSDEDAPKKSLTDAIIKAASQLGIAANIFLGRWDDQKYVAQVAEEFREKEGDHKPSGPVSAAEMKRGLVAIESDLLDCKTPLAVDKCGQGWWHISQRDGWTTDYVNEAKKKFDARKAALSKSDDADDIFPGDGPPPIGKNSYADAMRAG